MGAKVSQFGNCLSREELFDTRILGHPLQRSNDRGGQKLIRHVLAAAKALAEHLRHSGQQITLNLVSRLLRETCLPGFAVSLLQEQTILPLGPPILYALSCHSAIER